MGREFEARRDEFGRQPLLEVLVKQGRLSRDQKREVEDYCKRTGLAERDAVVQMKLATPEQAAQALSVQLGLSYVDLDDMLPEDSILGLAPLPLVKKHSFLPLFIDDGRLLIACVDHPDHGLEEELQLRYGVPARAVIATPRSISQAITKYSSLIGVDEGKAGAAAGAKAKPAGKSAPAKKQKTASADGERTPFSQLSEGEKLQRKQYGILIMCWGFIVPMLIDQFLLWDRIWRFVPVLEISRWISPLAFTIGPATVWWVLKRYWK
jgi:hypothetical protein